MLRSLIKTSAAFVLDRTGMDKLLRAVGILGNMPVVIGYHRVVEHFPSPNGNSIPAMLISLSMLERHLDWMGRRFRFVSLDELGSRLESGEPFPQPVAAITFDDGYRDFYHLAFPLLKRKGIPATTFVVTDLISTKEPYLHDKLFLLLKQAFSMWRPAPRTLLGLLRQHEIRLPQMERIGNAAGDSFKTLRLFLDSLSQRELRRVLDALESTLGPLAEVPEEQRSLSWEMLREMRDRGITIGSHTRTHPVLTNESWAKVVDELRGSREQLQRELGIVARHFAFPAGRFNPLVVRAVAEAGYQFGFTCCTHRDPDYPLLTIPRKLLWENACLDATGSFSPALMSCQMNWAFDLVSSCRQEHGAPRVPAVVPVQAA